ncbi:hypothetical protein FH972_025045 [Carpinus fangiana]|uniref:DNA2/NAM7 helicase-like C-terminal domain-containing protein n=1 Tax=Carpinus fangiana TaxID=176857 RepID=A0A5N6KZW6_9ROSI|nr:hypothetical protein FH972_025045 [Carpinus fangiana]
MGALLVYMLGPLLMISRTVSIVYPNESIITLAEVQANPYYRSLMNGFAETALLTHGPGQTTTKPAEGVFESGIATLSEWAASLALSSRRLWPSERSPVESMLLALLATAEAYLGQKVERATVLTPFSETQDELRMLLDNLLRHKGIEPCTHSDELTPQLRIFFATPRHSKLLARGKTATSGHSRMAVCRAESTDQASHQAYCSRRRPSPRAALPSPPRRRAWIRNSAAKGAESTLRPYLCGLDWCRHG